MPIPVVIDNQQHRMAETLNELLAQSAGKALDIASADFTISGYRLVKEGLHQVGAFRLLLGAEPHTRVDVGPRINTEALKKRLQSDLEAEPFNDTTLNLVEDLIAFLHADKVQVRLYDKGFLLAKAYHFHPSKIVTGIETDERRKVTLSRPQPSKERRPLPSSGPTLSYVTWFFRKSTWCRSQFQAGDWRSPPSPGTGTSIAPSNCSLQATIVSQTRANP
jgi:hypothetical protein